MVAKKGKNINSRLFAYSKKFPCSFCMGLFTTLVLGMTFPLYALVFSEAIFLMNFFTSPPQFRPPDYYDSYKLRCLEFMIIGVVTGFFQFFLQLFFSQIGQAVTRDLREKLYLAILRKPVSWFDRSDNEAGKLNSVLSADTAQLNSVASQSLGVYIQSFVALAAGVVFSIFYSWRLGLVVMGLAPFMIITGVLNTRLQRGFTANIDEAYKDSSSLVSEAVTNYRTIMSFANEELILKYYAHTLSLPYSSGIKRSHISGILFGYQRFSMWLLYGAAFLVAAVFLE